MCPKNNKKKVFPVNVFNYEVANHVPDDHDSIYAPEFESRQGGAIYIAEDKIREIVQDELAKRFGNTNEEVEGF